MGVLSDARIIEKIYDESVKIDPFIYDNVQPSSIDLTLGNRIQKPKENITTAVNLYDEQADVYCEQKIKEYDLEPGAFIIASVRENIKLPSNISGFIKNRSSLARNGLDVSTSSYVNPGYSGKLTITIKNINTIPITIYSGMRICQLVLIDVEPSAMNDYSVKVDAKYQNEQGGELGRLYLDKEFQEYKKREDKISISDFFEERLKKNETLIKDILTKNQKKQLGLK